MQLKLISNNYMYPLALW